MYNTEPFHNSPTSIRRVKIVKDFGKINRVAYQPVVKREQDPSEFRGNVTIDAISRARMR